MAQHTVQFYEQLDTLGHAVAAFLTQGLAQGQGGLVVATAQNIHIIRAALPDAPIRFLDAHEALEAVLVDGRPDSIRFRATIGQAIREVQAQVSGTVYAFGEMVALLQQRDDVPGAVALERLWNELAEDHDFRLLCAYPLQGFAGAQHAKGFQQVCAEHDEVFPAGARHWEPLGQELRIEVAMLQQKAASLEAEVRSRHEAEVALLERDARKNEFLAMLGHELRNPLTPISAALEIIAQRPDDPQYVMRARDVASRQVTVLKRLVEDVLDVARIQGGQVQIQRQEVAIADVVGRASEMAAELIRQRHHTLEVDVPEAFVEGDSVRLAQALANLLLNAARYTPERGHIVLQGRLEGKTICIEVVDDGEGMAPQMLDRVFEPFMQGSAAPVQQGVGIGLGLSIVRAVVGLHGGSVEAHSDGPGQGSRFVVRLPTVAAPAPQPEAQALHVTAPSGRRVLLVDDSVDITDSLADLLRSLGHEAHTANDGATALATGAGCRPDIAFIDISMPGMDGYTLGRKIRATPWGRNVQLVALSGFASDADQRRSREAGFDHHVGKPPELDVLERLLES